MSFDIDAILLDRVFQPVADGVANWASPFGLARGALVVAVEAQALALLWDAMRDPSGGNVLATGLVSALTVFGAQQAWRLIAGAERQGRAGTCNVRRVTLRGQRLAWLGIGGGCILVLLPQANIRAGAAVLGCLAWIALIYFVSCTPRPPALRRFGRFAALAS